MLLYCLPVHPWCSSDRGGRASHRGPDCIVFKIKKNKTWDICQTGGGGVDNLKACLNDLLPQKHKINHIKNLPHKYSPTQLLHVTRFEIFKNGNWHFFFISY